MGIIVCDGYVRDDHGNRATISKWGSEQKAIEALESCTGCRGCVDCYECTGCRGCQGCLGCSNCVSSGGLVECHRCASCEECSYCSDLFQETGLIDVVGQHGAPAVPDIHRQVYEAASQPGSFHMGIWSGPNDDAPCGMTCCRGGWAIHLAGEVGRDLSGRVGPMFAAMQIYWASGYDISPNAFFMSNEEALADMKRLAEAEIIRALQPPPGPCRWSSKKPEQKGTS